MKKWPIRWDLLFRYRVIEIIALWEGRLTTNHLIQSFGIGRQQASKDINSYLSDIAPNNLIYDKAQYNKNEDELWNTAINIELKADSRLKDEKKGYRI